MTRILITISRDWYFSIQIYFDIVKMYRLHEEKVSNLQGEYP